MIPAETCYETHDDDLLAIFEAFKTWKYYLEGCKHKVLVLIDYNKLRQFMDTKSMSSRQVRWAQSSLDIIFGLIIVRTRPMGLQMLSLTSLTGVRMKKKSFELRILEFFIVCSLCWQMQAIQASTSQPSYCYSTVCSSVARTSYFNRVNSEICSEPHGVMRAHTKSALVLCVWGS